MKTLLLIVALAMCASLAWGQEAPSGQEPHGRGAGRMGPPSAAERVKRMTKELNLTSDQQAKIKQILEEQDKNRPSREEMENLSPEERRAKFMQARQGVDSKIDAVLTDAQKQKFKEMKSHNRREHMNGEQPRPEGDGPPPDQPQQ